MNEYEQNEHDTDCECRDCVGHEDDCMCDACYDDKVMKADRMSEAEANNIWVANVNANNRMADLVGGFSDDEE